MHTIILCCRIQHMVHRHTNVKPPPQRLLPVLRVCPPRYRLGLCPCLGCHCVSVDCSRLYYHHYYPCSGYSPSMSHSACCMLLLYCPPSQRHVLACPLRHPNRQPVFHMQVEWRQREDIPYSMHIHLPHSIHMYTLLTLLHPSTSFLKINTGGTQARVSDMPPLFKEGMVDRLPLYTTTCTQSHTDTLWYQSKLGAYGYCLLQSGSKTCSSSRLGYEAGKTFLFLSRNGMLSLLKRSLISFPRYSLQMTLSAYSQMVETSLIQSSRA